MYATGALWNRCEPDASEPDGCPFGLPRTYHGSMCCSLGNRAQAVAAFLECDVYGFDPAAENGSPMVTWRASLPLGLHTASYFISRARDLSFADHFLLVVEGAHLLDFHFHGRDLNLVYWERWKTMTRLPPRR